MPVKPEVKEWLHSAGVWKYFCLRRDELKALGEKPAVARRKALAEYYHPEDEEPSGNGRPPEVEKPSEDKPSDDRASEDDVSLSGRAVDSDGLGGVTALPVSSGESARKVVVGPELMSKEFAFSSRDTSMLKSVKWVASVLGVQGLVPDDAPGPQAWSLYLTYSPRGKWEKFWSDFGKAMMPSKVDIENKDRMTDDGREVLSLLDRLEREHDAAVAQAGVVGKG